MIFAYSEMFLIVISFVIMSVSPFRMIFFPSRDTSVQAEKTLEKEKRHNYFDFLKGISIVAVVVIHVYYFFDLFKLGGKTFNDVGIFINNISRFTIPIFFICSGYLLKIEYDIKSIIQFFWKKIIRVIVPYLLVSIYIMWDKVDINDFFHNFLSGHHLVPYYFISLLMQFYLLYPILNKFAKSKRMLYISFFTSLLFILFVDQRYWYLNQFPLFPRFLFFFFYGIYLKNLNYEIVKKNLVTKYFWSGLILVFWIEILVFPEMLYNEQLFYGPAIFYLLFYYKEFLERKILLSRIFIHLGKMSLWIFLIHMIIMERLFVPIYNYIGKSNLYVMALLLGIVTFVMTYLIALVLFHLYNRILRKIIALV